MIFTFVVPELWDFVPWKIILFTCHTLAYTLLHKYYSNFKLYFIQNDRLWLCIIFSFCLSSSELWNFIQWKYSGINIMNWFEFRRRLSQWEIATLKKIIWVFGDSLIIYLLFMPYYYILWDFRIIEICKWWNLF